MHGLLLHVTSFNCSHVFPSYASVHMHSNSPRRSLISIHKPPLLHGLDSHSSISISQLIKNSNYIILQIGGGMKLKYNV